MKAPVLLMFFFFLVSTLSWGQEYETEHEELESGLKHHKIMLVLGHTHVPSGINVEGKKTWLALSSWGIDYDYRINRLWSVGLHTDMVLENFEIENEKEVIKDRSRPIAMALMASRKLNGHFSLMAGGGGEYAKEESFALVRLGAEYSLEYKEEWEFGASLMADFKIEGYNSWVIGFGVAKLF
ncbi:hypothetical protein R9C00_07935 [Flammeovirgaceae bacterium SG7u.111]|nr:hypothetical protein [Flammeovirgaceae bacterium SG7u.132]WPO37376.1 hypothetical protein R9C00_07935 [Flammeovirgaceae bacterium SG7u.111]